MCVAADLLPEGTVIYYSSGLWEAAGLLVLQIFLKNLFCGGWNKSLQMYALFFTFIQVGQL